VTPNFIEGPAFAGFDMARRVLHAENCYECPGPDMPGASRELARLIGALIQSDWKREGLKRNQEILKENWRLDRTLDGDGYLPRPGVPQRPTRRWWEFEPREECKRFAREVHLAPRTGADLRGVAAAFRAATPWADLVPDNFRSQLDLLSADEWQHYTDLLIRLLADAPIWGEVTT
jgi:hypothetical protein